MEELNDNLGKAVCYDNIGAVYLAKKNYTKAMKNFITGLTITRSMKAPQREASILGKMGMCYLEMAKRTKASSEEDGRREISSDYLPAEGFENLQKAIKHLTESVELCKKIGNMDNLREYSNSLAEAYSVGGDYKDALISFRQYTSIRDSVSRSQNRASLINASFTY
jgi:tetratricopeptide (TPR) repeat protein